MKRLTALSLLLAGSAMAQVSGPLVDAPALMGTSESVAVIAMRGEAAAFAFRGFRISRSHEIEKATNDSLRKSALRTLAPSLTVPANAPFTQNTNYLPMGAPISANFEALGVGTPGFVISGAPPDTTLAVSDTQIVQWVNTQLAVYNKSGSPLLPSPGFVNGNQIWATLPVGSLCREFNQGDPILQFDRMARRWILSQFAFNGDGTNNAQCIAVSQTDNALGAYYLYEYNFGTELPDYGKMGLWPDALYITYNMFPAAGGFSGGRACAYDKVKMYSGLPAAQICFNSTDRFSFLPADMDGKNPPPPGAPNPHISWDWAFLPAPPYTMQLTMFKPDFVTPANSTFNDGQGGAAFSFIGFDLGATTLASCNDGGGSCVRQVGTPNVLDTLGSRHMYRLVYRNFGTYDSLLFTQSVDNVTGATAQLRWWELRKPLSGAPVVHQNSTFSPDATMRWMGSAAFDKQGNMAVGYSASSTEINPGIRIAGRRATDPRNILRAEQTVFNGTGSQTGTLRRWGDYSTMQIDPANECTFWYTTQYIGSNGTFNWRTRIAGFKFPSCN